MKRCFIVLLCIICSGIHLYGNDTVTKETYIYAIKGSDTLRLDKYDLPAIKEAKSCIIFMFGGGFVSGIRDAERYKNYFSYFAKKGYVVISIDYRLGMKNLKTTDPMWLVATLNNSINMAVEDLFSATSYTIDQAKAWNIDTSRIVANGSSAGAVSVLQAEYAICNGAEATKILPTNFNYAGIISFAGAVFSLDGDLKWKKSPSPIQLFHGDADRNVPYNKIEVDRYGLYGSKYIADQLSQLGSPNYFHVTTNAAHEIADRAMDLYLKETADIYERESKTR
ncbi:MAG: carboxylesterase family protein [Dysgonomonas sp.]|nr:carboxylesterase family protein [Dysgonomonas sp.]